MSTYDVISCIIFIYNLKIKTISNQNNEIIFSNIGPNTSIQLITLSGLVLKDFFSMYNGQSIKWNGTDNSGSLIPSGIYLLVSSNSKQNSSVTKIAIVR